MIERMQALSAQYPRFGYRRMRIFLGRDGYRDEPWPGVSVVAGGKTAGAAQASKKACGASRPRPQAPGGPNQVWSFDFVFDAVPTASSSSA